MRALRASLVNSVVQPPAHARDAAAEKAPIALDDDDTTPPSAVELLSASPALVRLCESYHRTHATMATRGRRQRLGIFLLVCGIGIGSLLLRRSGAVSADLVSDLVLAVAGASAVSVVLLGLLWLRDDRRLRGLQGDRLLRALQSNCTLPADRIVAFRKRREPVTAFFDCYATWRDTLASKAPAGSWFTHLRGTRTA
ncbi:MAG TPA: hypothetical protein VFO60_10985 [Candidatus Dormibacteraeota bacterium]|nr:hypothetical protein [Candidatus Dormibacteraeota bacterium]